MKTRSWWIELPVNNPFFNFLWKPFSQGINFEETCNSPIKQVVNHFENHKEISRKSKLFLNFQEFAEVLYTVDVLVKS